MNNKLLSLMLIILASNANAGFVGLEKPAAPKAVVVPPPVAKTVPTAPKAVPPVPVPAKTTVVPAAPAKTVPAAPKAVVPPVPVPAKTVPAPVPKTAVVPPVPPVAKTQVMAPKTLPDNNDNKIVLKQPPKFIEQKEKSVKSVKIDKKKEISNLESQIENF